MRHVANGQVVAECFQLLWQVNPTLLPSPLLKPVRLRPSESTHTRRWDGCRSPSPLLSGNPSLISSVAEPEPGLFGRSRFEEPALAPP